MNSFVDLKPHHLHSQIIQTGLNILALWQEDLLVASFQNWPHQNSVTQYRQWFDGITKQMLMNIHILIFGAMQHVNVQDNQNALFKNNQSTKSLCCHCA
jgi:hypothetical protein